MVKHTQTTRSMLRMLGHFVGLALKVLNIKSYPVHIITEYEYSPLLVRPYEVDISSCQ